MIFVRTVSTVRCEFHSALSKAAQHSELLMTSASRLIIQPQSELHSISESSQYSLSTELAWCDQT